jgi:NAD(P)-dependent dehydrogenase (short-subunit alcohol dehydrogenase family)
MPEPGPLARTVDRLLEASVVGSFGSTGTALRRRFAHWDRLEDAGIGRRVLVTGANRGLGLASARALLSRGAEVVLTARDEDRAVATAELLTREVGGDAASRITPMTLELGELASVRALAARLAVGSPLDVVVHNAGAMFPTRELTVDGLETTYQVHVVAPFLLTALLLPMLTTRTDARVVTVSSGGMYTEQLVVRRLDSSRSYRPSVAYARAKRAQVELGREWHRRIGSRTGTAFHVMHPGWARTPGLESSLPGFARLASPVLRRPEDAIDTVTFLALAPRDRPELDGGAFWHDRLPRTTDRLKRTHCEQSERDALWSRVSADAGVDLTGQGWYGPASAPNP